MDWHHSNIILSYLALSCKLSQVHEKLISKLLQKQSLWSILHNHVKLTLLWFFFMQFSSIIHISLILALICTHTLTHWILDFLSFEMIYSMPKNDPGKYSKYHLKIIIYVVARIWVPIGMYELQAISFNLLSHVWLLSNSFHNLYFFLSCNELLLFHLSKFSSCFTLLELVLSISSLISTMIGNELSNLHFFSSFKPKIWLKIYVRSMARVLATIQVMLGELDL